MCEFDETSYPATLVDSVLNTFHQEMRTLLKYVKPSMIRVRIKEFDGFVYLMEKLYSFIHILQSIKDRNELKQSDKSRAKGTFSLFCRN